MHESEEQRGRRLQREAEYRERCRANDPEGYRRRQLESARRYRTRHPDKPRASTQKWRAANPEKLNAQRRRWRVENRLKVLVKEARSRAKATGLEFAITVHDLLPMPERCPLLGHPFSGPEEGRTSFSPSIDRKDPSKGYVPGGVWVVGYRANRIKNDGSAEEHEMIAKAMREALAGT